MGQALGLIFSSPIVNPLSLPPHKTTIHKCVLSSDGLFALSASSDNTTIMWNTRVPERPAGVIPIAKESCPIHNSQASALSADGFVALTVFDQIAYVWKLSTSGFDRAGYFRTLEGHRGYIQGSALSFDGSRALTVAYDMKGFVWDVDSGNKLAVMELSGGLPKGCSLSADGMTALTGPASRSGKTELWDLREVNEGKSQKICDLGLVILESVLSANGRVALTASDPTKAYTVWDIDAEGKREKITPRCELVERRDGSVQLCACALSFDGSLAVTATRYRLVKDSVGL
eukprot:834388-Amorphochlora_amoeboformis.AAC.1